MRSTVVLMVLVFCAVLATAAGAESTDGAALYKSKCASCHKLDGAGSKASANTVLKGVSAEDAKHKMQGYLDGSYGGSRKVIMKRLLTRFSPQEIDALAEHIGTLQ